MRFGPQTLPLTADYIHKEWLKRYQFCIYWNTKAMVKITGSEKDCGHKRFSFFFLFVLKGSTQSDFPPKEKGMMMMTNMPVWQQETTEFGIIFTAIHQTGFIKSTVIRYRQKISPLKRLLFSSNSWCPHHNFRPNPSMRINSIVFHQHLICQLDTV